MPLEVTAKSTDESVRRLREAAANRVIAEFGNQIPALRLLCFFDDEDWRPFKIKWGEANRGFYRTLRPEPLPNWPPYLLSRIFVQNPPASSPRQVAFDHVIYLYDSTCSNEVGLTMTFVHELQHFLQHVNATQIWAANTLVANLKSDTRSALGLRCFDIPHERQARIASKRIAEGVFGANPARKYIDERIAERQPGDDVADWEFVRQLDPLTQYDLAGETKMLFPRLSGCRPELDTILNALKSKDDVFACVNLDALLVGRNQ
jgi:hypothetical protein